MIILWIILFVLALLISYVLASRSMRDFSEVPTSADYSLFLIRNVKGLNEHLLNLIYQDLQQTNAAVSFERLFKGQESALVVFGPRTVLTKFIKPLNLLELEDYTNVDGTSVASWEIGIKNSHQNDSQIPHHYGAGPILERHEQLWWQVIIWKGGSHIRCLLVSADGVKRKNLAQVLPHFPSSKLTKLPKAFSNEQLFEAYQKRSFPKNQKVALTAQEILKLLWM